MVNLETATSVLVTSDVHLGDKFCRRDNFSNWLLSIFESRKKGKLPYLRALIILGDFFDLIWNAVENLCSNNNFIEIYELLQALRNNGIEIIFVLGNHEISTWGFYNWEFSHRKKSFLEKLEINDFSFGFLNENIVCQYVILSHNSINKPVLALFDSIYDIKFGEHGQISSGAANREIILKHKPLIDEYCYFMAHGYQFENKFLHHMFLAPLWKSFVEDDNERDVLNEFGYGFKQLNMDITPENIERVASNNNIDISEFPTNKIKKDLSKLDKRLKHDGRNINYEIYHQQITEFMKVERLQQITHVIFGHSHVSETSQIEGLTILNASCWIKNKESYYIEIYTDGNSKVKEVI